MAETQSAEVNLEELLNRVRTQPLQEQVDNIRFRPLAAKAEKRKAKIDKQKKKAAKLTDKINKGNLRKPKPTASSYWLLIPCQNLCKCFFKG